MEQPYKYIASGFIEDSRKLISTFTDMESVQFSDFSKVWREMKFSLIFWGREKSEMPFFIQECFKVLTSQLMPDIDANVKYGLLYTIYGMYVKQKCEPRIRIRLTMAQFYDLSCVVFEAKTKMHLDVCYIFLTLCCENAFYFVCNPTPLAPRKHNGVETDAASEPVEQDQEYFLRNSILLTRFHEDRIADLEACHERYECLKEMQANSEIQSLKTVKTDHLKKTKTAIRKLEKQFGKAEYGDDDDESSQDEESSNQDSAGNTRRVAIMERQYEAQTTGLRFLKSKQTTVDDPTTSA